MQWFLALCLTLLAGCATHRPLPGEYRPDARVATLSAAVSFSFHSVERNMSGSGHLVYARPDRLHLVVLSPFGNPLLDAYAVGGSAALIYPAQALAFVGGLAELPSRGGLQGWKMLAGVFEADPHGDAGFSGTVKRTGRSGDETVTYRNGLPVARDLGSGERIHYGRYAVIDGVPLAHEYEVTAANQDRVRIVLEDAEVNRGLEEGAFQPDLSGKRIYPLGELEGL